MQTFDEFYVKQLPKNCEECVFAQEEEYGIITTCKLLDILDYWPDGEGQLDNETFDGWCSFDSRYPKCPLKKLNIDGFWGTAYIGEQCKN